MATNYKTGKLCIGLAQQEEYLSEFEFKGSNRLKGVWIVQDWKNEFYQYVKAVRKSLNAKNGTYLFKKISFTIGRNDFRHKRILSNQLYRLGVKRKRALTINHNKEISFYPRDISSEECSKFYGCDKGKVCLQCADYFNLKTVKKINFRFKVKDVLQLINSKKRFRAKINVGRNHYIVRGYSMTKYPSITKKVNKESWPLSEEQPKIFYLGEFMDIAKYEKLKIDEQEAIDEALERTNRSSY